MIIILILIFLIFLVIKVFNFIILVKMDLIWITNFNGDFLYFQWITIFNGDGDLDLHLFFINEINM